MSDIPSLSATGPWIGAHASWANTQDRTARTAPARAALDASSWLRRRGPEACRVPQAHYGRLALKSGAGRDAAEPVWPRPVVRMLRPELDTEAGPGQDRPRMSLTATRPSCHSVPTSSRTSTPWLPTSMARSLSWSG